MLPLDPFIQKKAVSLPESATVREAATTLCGQQIGCILVTDSRGALSGIVTDRDLACAPARSGAELDDPISLVMTRHPATVPANARLERVIHLMEESGIRRVPVIDPNGLCVGIVTLDDLVASGRIPLEQVATIVRAQILRRLPPELLARRGAGPTHGARTSLNQFYSAVEERTGLGPDLLIPVTETILGALVRRIHYTGAAQFISRLPTGLQETLLEAPAGPHPEITAATLVQELSARHSLPPERARSVLKAFFSALSEVIEASALDRLASQLPEELSALFPRREKGAA